MIQHLKIKSKIFYDELFSNFLFAGILAAYILLKAISNLVSGASYLRHFDGIMGVVMYVAGMYMINSSNNTGKKDFQIDTRAAKGIGCFCNLFLFLLVTIINNLRKTFRLPYFPSCRYNHRYSLQTDFTIHFRFCRFRVAGTNQEYNYWQLVLCTYTIYYV